MVQKWVRPKIGVITIFCKNKLIRRSIYGDLQNNMWHIELLAYVGIRLSLMLQPIKQ